MNNQEILEIISSFAAGCIDKKNFDNLIEYIESGGKLPEGKLGELQNLVALLSLTVNKQKAPVSLKSKVAKKLITVQTEIKERIREEKSLTKDTNFDVPKETTSNKLSKTTITEEEKPNSLKPAILDKIKEETTYNSMNKPTENNFNISDKYKIEKSESTSNFLSIILSILALVVIILLYFALNSNINDLEKKYDKLEKEFEKNKNSLNLASTIISKNKLLINYFEDENIKLINLKGTAESPASTAKILFNKNKNEAIFKISNLPSLNKNEVYQLWIVTKNSTYPLKSFTPQEEDNFILINSLPSIPEKDILQYKVTQEKIKDNEIPEGKVILIGIFA